MKAKSKSCNRGGCWYLILQSTSFSLLLSVGAVVCVQSISNPVSLARKVMTETSHCMLAGDGALKFARNIGFPILEDPSVLISDCSYQMYVKEKLRHENHNKHVNHGSVATHVTQENRDTNLEGHDTVGAVAIDINGHIAATSSTGNTQTFA